jgi:hypothetical protein
MMVAWNRGMVSVLPSITWWAVIDVTVHLLSSKPNQSMNDTTMPHRSSAHFFSAEEFSMDVTDARHLLDLLSYDYCYIHKRVHFWRARLADVRLVKQFCRTSRLWYDLYEMSGSKNLFFALRKSADNLSSTIRDPHNSQNKIS